MRYSTASFRLELALGLILITTGAWAGAQEANLLLNPGAEQGKDKLPSIWHKAAVPADGLTMCRYDKEAHSGGFCLAISNTHEYAQQVCNNWAQDIMVVPAGENIRLSAYIKTENADAVNVCMQCWGPGQSPEMLAFASTPVVRGDQDWTLMHSETIVVPPETRRILVRAALTGLGKAWFDDFSVVVVDIPSPVARGRDVTPSMEGGRKYSQGEIESRDAEFFFKKVAHPEEGYHWFAGLWALQDKAKTSDAKTIEKIIARASEIIQDPNESYCRRWQCCYVISGIGDERGIAALIHALTNDKDKTVRCCAACALGAFYNDRAIAALKQAADEERNMEVLTWIYSALEGQFRKEGPATKIDAERISEKLQMKAEAELDEAFAKDYRSIIKILPIVKDCMVLKYLPRWAHGNVDNIAVANNEGGVRTLLAWPQILQQDAADPDLRFLIGLYSRKTTTGKPTGAIGAYEILSNWPECTSWQTQPPIAEEPAVEFKFLAGDGWKLFDVTALIRDQLRDARRCHGLMLRFAQENRSSNDRSGYAFVSREGLGEWLHRRPRLLIVHKEGNSQ